MRVLRNPAAHILLYGLLAYTIVRLLRCLLTKYLLPGQPEQGIISLDEVTAHYYSRNGFLALLFLVGGYYVLWCLKSLDYQTSVHNFAVLLYLTGTIFWFAWLLRKPYLENLLAWRRAWPPPLLGGRDNERFSVSLVLCAVKAPSLSLTFWDSKTWPSIWPGLTFLTALVIAGGWLVEQLGRDLNNFLTRSQKRPPVAKLGIKSETLADIHLFLSQTFDYRSSFCLPHVRFLGLGSRHLSFAEIPGPYFPGALRWGLMTLSPLAIILAVPSIFVARRLSHLTRLVLEKRFIHKAGLGNRPSAHHCQYNPLLPHDLWGLLWL